MVPFSIRVVVTLVLLGGGAWALPLASAGAASRACPAGGDRTLVTWAGVQTQDGGGEYSPDARLVSGLAGSADGVDTSLKVVTRKAGRGRVAVLCSNERQLAVLSSLRRGEVVGSASVNGRRVAWRTFRQSAPGLIKTAAIRSGKVRAVHSSPVPFLGADGGSSAIHLLPSGTVAWQVSGRSWVWPIGRRPVRVPSTPGPAAPSNSSIRILDGRNVLVNGRVRAYRKPVAGTCAPVIGAASVEIVGGWRVWWIDNGSVANDFEFSSTQTVVICDPVSGRYIATESGGHSSGTYVGDPGASSSPSFNRSGDWLVTTTTKSDGGGYAGSSVEGRNLATGAHFKASGFVEVEGREHPAEGSPPDGSPFQPRWATGVIVAPGMIAWCSSDPAADGVWLADANGTRRVGDATPTPAAGNPTFASCGLRERDGTLEWGPADASRRVTIVPAGNRAFG